MVEGRLRKFYQEVVFLEQIFVVDEETKISRLIEKAAQQAGAAIGVGGFARFALGEGMPRPKSGFAAEAGSPVEG
jgi:elongation factor Ts